MSLVLNKCVKSIKDNNEIDLLVEHFIEQELSGFEEIETPKYTIKRMKLDKDLTKADK